MRIARPARRWISSALRFSTSQVPPPTVPMPSSPTLIGFMPPQAGFEVAPHVGPFRRQHAVHHGVANGAVAPRRVVADHAVLLRAERLDGALRAEVEVVGTQADDPAFDLVEAELEQQKFAGRIDVADRKSTRLNSSHGYISYAVFCLKKKTYLNHELDDEHICEQ